MATYWHPDADTSVRHSSKNATQDDRYPARGVLHTTETEWLPSYAAPSAPPHFTVMPSGYFYQHMPVNEVSGALRNVGWSHWADTGIDPDTTGRLNI